MTQAFVVERTGENADMTVSVVDGVSVHDDVIGDETHVCVLHRVGSVEWGDVKLA